MRSNDDPLSDLIDQLSITETMDGPEAAHDAAMWAVARILNRSRNPHAVLRDARAKADMSDVDLGASPTDLTNQIRADLRSLNHLLANGDAYTYPAAVYDTIGNLHGIAAMLPQALQETAAWIKREAVAGRLRSVDPSQDAERQLNVFAEWMRAAGGAAPTPHDFMGENNGTAGKLAAELNKAWSSIGAIAANDPRTNPIAPILYHPAGREKITPGADAPAVYRLPRTEPEPVYRDVIMQFNRREDGEFGDVYRTRCTEDDIPSTDASSEQIDRWATGLITSHPDYTAPAEQRHHIVTVQIQTDQAPRWMSAVVILGDAA